MEKFSKKTGSKWPKDKAQKEINAYKAHRHDGLRSAKFGRDAVDEILKDENCHGLMIEMALGDDGHEKVIISGVDADGNKIEDSDTNASMTCPPFCGGDEPPTP